MNEIPPQKETARSTDKPEPITLRQFFESVWPAKEKNEAIAESSDAHQILRKVLEDCESQIEETTVETHPWVPALEWIISISATLFLFAWFAYFAIRIFGV